MTASTILTLIIMLCALAACGETPGFDEGSVMRADVQRVQSDRCLISISHMWGGKAYLARLEGCKS